MMHEKHPEFFQLRVLGGDPVHITQFWDAMRDHPALVIHPVKDRAEYKRFAVPLGLHGDGVAISGISKSWSRSVDVYSWSSLIGQGPTMLTNFMIYLLFANMICKEGP